MKSTYITTLVFLITTSTLALEQLATDKETAAKCYPDCVKRLRTRSLLEARNDPAQHQGQLQFDDSASEGPGDVKDKPPVLTNFLEDSQLKDHWADIICENVTQIPSNQETEIKLWQWTIQGTHKNAESLTHEGNYLNLFVIWQPYDLTLLPKFDNVKVDLCKQALVQAAGNTNTVKYVAGKTVQSVKNRHLIGISTPQTRNSGGDQFALMILELGDHNKDVKLFNGNGLPG